MVWEKRGFQISSSLISSTSAALLLCALLDSCVFDTVVFMCSSCVYIHLSPAEEAGESNYVASVEKKVFLSLRE